MSDRFKFRGINNDGKMVIGSLVVRESEYSNHMIKTYKKVNGKTCQVTFIVKPETVGQSTGLRDKNGVLIFEGDIYKCEFISKDYVSSVVWNHSGFDITEDWAARHEVIGNIYQDKQLLDEGEQG